MTDLGAQSDDEEASNQPARSSDSSGEDSESDDSSGSAPVALPMVKFLLFSVFCFLCWLSDVSSMLRNVANVDNALRQTASATFRHVVINTMVVTASMCMVFFCDLCCRIVI